MRRQHELRGVRGAFAHDAEGGVDEEQREQDHHGHVQPLAQDLRQPHRAAQDEPDGGCRGRGEQQKVQEEHLKKAT